MRPNGRAPLEAFGAMVLAFVLVALGWGEWFLLAPPLAERPWTIATSVFGHAGLGHLVANGLGVVVLGPLVARRTSRLRFHAFFLVTGAIAGVAEVVLGGIVSGPTAVLGSSGAVFALLGYLLAGNVVSAVILDRLALSRRAQFVLFLAVAVLVTVATAGSKSALFGHATGLVVGLAAGRAGLLDRRS